MNTDSCRGRLVESLKDGGAPGSYEFTLKRDQRTGQDIIGGMNFVCLGCKTLSHLAFRKPGAWPPIPQRDWHWNGAHEHPTLLPSIHHKGCWHGHLINGLFKSC